MHFVRNILALPLRLAAVIAGLIPIVDVGTVLHLILRVTDDPEDGLRYLAYGLTRFGYAEMEPVAQKLMERYRDSRFAEMMGNAAFFKNNKISAKEWTLAAEYADCTNLEMLLGLKYQLSLDEPKEKRLAILDEIISRRDLPMAISLQAYPIRCYSFLLEREWGKAVKLAEKILQIIESPMAHLANYCKYYTAGKDEAAFKELCDAQRLWQMGPFESVGAQICYVAGDMYRACEYLAMAIDGGFDPDKAGEEWKELAQSDDFNRFMDQRQAGND
ncbi:hypothetical protein SMSP2_02668 [Limihaloglobus sulfuriphilus]|uniref:PEP-CTERM system TPR-repeat lipoprotein n=1 Tax=Limihaloglobus sulfuriphilus TaxID=1851148 RepID=A0A1Q2MHU9_9BACT|nr:hypothetical protein [Limihaloglobus sulfuriphilus]AQQ72285.1 hypothetical protein SMSP2_02668 [Limihaloglobus sulfuriphilus]